MTFLICTRGRNNNYDIPDMYQREETITMTFLICTRGRNNSYDINYKNWGWAKVITTF